MVNQGYLKWQLRRGKLELDMVLQRFVEQHPLETMVNSELTAFQQLLAGSDEELLDLFLRKTLATAPEQAQLVEKIVAASVPE